MLEIEIANKEVMRKYDFICIAKINRSKNFKVKNTIKFGANKTTTIN